MDIQLNNYNDIYIKKHSAKFNNNNITKLNKKYIGLNIYNIVNILKANKSLSPYEDYKVLLYFENFNYTREFLFTIKKHTHNFLYKIKLVKDVFPDSSWSTDFKNSIHITKDIYSKETSFTEFLNNNLTSNEVLNYVFLHELGHSINSDLKYKNGLNFSSENNIKRNIKDFINETISFTDINFLLINSNYQSEQKLVEKELNLAVYNGMKEGFADLYASIAVSIIYPKEQAINILQKVIEGRNYSDIWCNEYYHSKKSIGLFLNEYRNNTIDFKNFIDIKNYIEKTISKNIMDNLTNEINNKNDNDQFVNHYFGVLKNKLKPKNCETLNEMINYINEKYNLNFNNRIENEYFKIGYSASNKNSPNPKINIKKIRDLSMNDCNINKIKP